MVTVGPPALEARSSAASVGASVVARSWRVKMLPSTPAKSGGLNGSLTLFAQAPSRTSHLSVIYTSPAPIVAWLLRRWQLDDQHLEAAGRRLHPLAVRRNARVLGADDHLRVVALLARLDAGDGRLKSAHPQRAAVVLERHHRVLERHHQRALL